MMTIGPRVTRWSAIIRILREAALITSTCNLKVLEAAAGVNRKIH